MAGLDRIWPQAQFRLIEAPRRASAARNCSSSSDDRVCATSATALSSGARDAAGPSRRDSGAWRSASLPTALQPKKRLTRSRITSEACWISSAIALEIQHASDVILERVNRFFGWSAVGRLALRQAPLSRREGPAASRAPDDKAVAEVAQTLSSDEDEQLRAALARLGASIKRN